MSVRSVAKKCFIFILVIYALFAIQHLYVLIRYVLPIKYETSSFAVYSVLTAIEALGLLCMGIGVLKSKPYLLICFLLKLVVDCCIHLYIVIDLYYKIAKCDKVHYWYCGENNPNLLLNEAIVFGERFCHCDLSIISRFSHLAALLPVAAVTSCLIHIMIKETNPHTKTVEMDERICSEQSEHMER